MDAFATMLVVTTAAGLATGLGAVPTLFGTRVSHRTYDAALGLAGGIMVAASVFGLILPGMELGSLLEVMVGVFLGGFGLLAGNRLIPHLHAHYEGRRRAGSGGTAWQGHGGAPDASPVGPPPALARDDPPGAPSADAPSAGATSADAPSADATSAGATSATGDSTGGLDDRIRRAVLVGGAITLHNAPEGLAMGIAFASGLEEVAFVLAVVIGLQNVPDGFAFAVPVGQAGVSPRRVLVYTTLSGLVPQVLAAVVGFGLVAVATGVFPVAAGFAAGAMLGVVFREMVPSSHGHGHADAATAAFLVGFALLVVVDAVVAV